jgi:ABC-2 type transport system permease protein
MVKNYLSFFRIRFTNGLQYRAAAYAGVVTQFAWGFMEILMFKAFYRTNPAAFPMEFSQLSSYIWLQQAFLALFMTWFLENDILLSITNGNVAYELVRPMNLYNMWFVKNLANRMAKAMLRCLPILVVAVFLPKPYNISLPISFAGFLLFIASMAFWLLVVVAFCMLIYITTFFTLSPMGIRIVAVSLVEFLSGGLIPLPFLPDPIRSVLELLPFGAMQNIPLRIYSGNIAGKELAVSICLQVFWLTVLIFTGKAFMNKALRKVVVQGG